MTGVRTVNILFMGIGSRFTFAGGFLDGFFRNAGCVTFRQINVRFYEKLFVVRFEALYNAESDVIFITVGLGSF